MTATHSPRRFGVLMFIAAICFSLFSCKGKTPTNSSNGGTADITVTATSSNPDKDFPIDKIQLLPGFQMHAFAKVPGARSMCFGEKGTLFIGTMGEGKVYAVTDTDRNGIADHVFTIASDLDMPNGVAFRNGSLYVAENHRILRFDHIENDLAHPSPYAVVYDKFPTDKTHGWKFIAFGPDDKLYVPVGAPCNICEPGEPYASITRMNADGSGFEIFAKGIRNTVGFTWHPETKAMWFTDNGRDMLGDDIPNDELNVAAKPGMNFGYPYCHQGDIPDPEYGKNKECKAFTPPVLKLGPHVASLGLRFYTGSLFPAAYKNQLFIAEHGSWNRSKKIGYRVMLVKLNGSQPAEYTEFAKGWLQPNEDVLGRPVDVQVAPDGALLVSDDMKGVVYRITPK